MNLERTEEYYIDKCISLFSSVIKKHTKNIKEADMFLTGGYDSRFIALMIKKQNKIKINTFTTRKPLDNNNDKRYAKQVAEYLGISNTFVEPKIDKNDYQLPLIKKMKSKVVFDAVGGYILLRGTFSNEVFISHKGYRKFLGKDVKLKNHPNFITIYLLETEAKQLMELSKSIMPDKKVIFPFMDKDFIKFALTIPPSIKSNEFYKKILEKVDVGCIAIPSTRDIWFFNFRRHSTIREIRNKIYRVIKKCLGNFLY